VGARRTPEKDFQDTVLQWAKLFHWRAFYIPDWMYRLAMASMLRQRKADRPWPDPGFPDLVLLKVPDLIFAELKSGSNKPTDKQDAWHEDLRACGLRVYVWRESDIDEIIQILARTK
jgi:hypothetical protein